MGVLAYRCIALGIVLLNPSLTRLAWADTYTVDFSSSSLYDSSASTGLWNTVSSRIQAAVAANSTAGNEVGFGNGSDGAFSDGPAQTGVSVSGNTITIDTDTKSTFQFSSFLLSASKTLVITGSQKLILRVLGATSIAGTVTANGSAGTSNGSAGVGGQTLGTLAGGSGVASGSSGGNAGSVSPVTSGTDGSPTSGNTRGGSFFANQNGSTNERGGGGGCNGADGAATYNAADGAFAGGAAGACPSTRAVTALAFESSFAGGGGGGGGGACSGGTCAAVVGGGAGGGGAGAIRIASLGAVSIAGTLQAKGGAGGSNDADNGTATDCGGGGGGGSGGSIWFQTLSTLSGAGGIDITGGAAGTSASCGNSYDGGVGSRGVFRADTASGAQALTTLTPEAGVTDALQSVGIASGQTYTVTSKSLDFSDRYVDFVSATETTGCGANGTMAVAYQGSTDGTNFGSSVSAAAISQLNGSTYLRFVVTIATTGANPPCLTGLTVTTTESELSSLTLSGGMVFCGNLGSTKRGNPWAFLTFLFPFLLMYLGRRRLGGAAEPTVPLPNEWHC